jgi:hypothetical protein
MLLKYLHCGVFMLLARLIMGKAQPQVGIRSDNVLYASKITWEMKDWEIYLLTVLTATVLSLPVKVSSSTSNAL